MTNKLIGSVLIKSERYYETKNGKNKDTVICGFGDSNNGIIEQDLRKYSYYNNIRVLEECTSILKESSIKNKY